MIADDVAAALSKAGCIVVGVAGSVPKALKLVQEAGCDAAVLDANLDGLSAEPIAVALQHKSIPFLVLSGYASEQRSPALSLAPFLAKPYNEVELVAMVKGLSH